MSAPQPVRDSLPGQLWTFEGPEGSGKTTQIQRLEARLAGLGIAPLRTREPGGTPAAEAFRQLLLKPPGPDFEPLTDSSELLLMLAGRSQHFEGKIAPALAQGRLVLCDRFVDSSLAYQGFGRGLDQDLIRRLNSLVCRGRAPDLTLVFDLPAEVGLARAGKDGFDRIEAAGQAFHQRVSAGYREIAAKEPERVRLVDASGTPDEVEANLWAILEPHLQKAVGEAP